ncbi:hypothetical protein JQX13_24775 [Archangium violaceum]|nr:hypothetical protein [Archangium violaceum]QRK12963.1 hypothetical protein JQX13_24775 [Archangium violaceum]
MKYIGGVIVILYALMAFSGCEPFTRSERGRAGVLGSGVRTRTGGFMGGK